MIKRRKPRIWQLKQGVGITHSIIPEWKGIVIEPGDEVSQIKLTDGTRMYVSNEHLVQEEE